MSTGSFSHSNHTDPSKLKPRKKAKLRNLRDYLRALPEDEFVTAALEYRATEYNLRQLIGLGAVKPVGTDGEAKQFKLTELGEHFRDEPHSQTFCPCDHRGVRNLGDGLYTCSFDLCEKRYTRDEVDI